MKRKIIIGSILAVFLIMTTSIGSVMGTETENSETKESPLFKIRTKEAITEKIETIKENIKTTFISKDRIFFAPLVQNIVDRSDDGFITVMLTVICPCTIGPTTCIFCIVLSKVI